MAVMRRFYVKIGKAKNGCWIWLGERHDRGYGRFRFRGRKWMAHRVSHVIHKGEIASGLEVDHLCFEKLCVNPEHLEAVTPEENTRRYARKQWPERWTIVDRMG